MSAATLASPPVFRAISDPTRRAILDLLAGAEAAVGELVERFTVSQPAISQHLRVLQEADLVRCRKDGRRRLYRLHAEPLREVHDWVAHYEDFWETRLDALGAFLDEEHGDA